MTKKPPLAVIIIVIVICFALGVINVFLTAPDEPGPAPTLQTTALPSETETALRSVLILGVDRLDMDHPSLRSIWFALFQPGGDTVYLHGIELSATAAEIDPGTLQEVFTWNREGGINETFRRVLYHILPLSPDLTIMLDDQAFVSAIEYLGGIEVQGERVSGEWALAYVTEALEDDSQALANQATIIKAMIPEALKLAPSPELTDLINLMPDHASLSVEVGDALALLSPLRTVSEENVFFILLPASE